MKYTLARFAALAIAPTLILSACRDNAAGSNGVMSPDVYVAVMGELADLRRSPPPGIDREDIQARTDSAREAILSAHGVTAPDLLEFARKFGSDPAQMERLTDQIVAITDSLATIRDSISADTMAIPPEAIPDAPEDTLSESRLRSTRDSLGAQNRVERDSIRRALKLPSR